LRIPASTREYSEAILEVIAYLHPAVDPEAGHYVCHHHSIGASVIETGSGPLPALVIGGCALLVEGEDHVSRILGNAREARLEGFIGDKAVIGDARVDPYWVSQAIRAASEIRGEARFYTVGFEGEEWAGILIEWREGKALLLVPPSCGEDALRRRSQTFYQ
jgi:hypothetical protein